MIKAKIPAANPEANLKSYLETRKTFQWEDVAKEFSWYHSGKVNIIHEAVDRWAQDPSKRNQTAILFDKDKDTLHIHIRNMDGLIYGKHVF